MQEEKTKGKKSLLDRTTSSNLTRLYIVALTTVALLTIIGQVLIQNSIKDQLSDSYVVNMAGKQRYMSQQISKVVLLIYGNIPHVSYPDKVESLKSLLYDWKKNHWALQRGDPELKLEGNNSAEISRMFQQLEGNFNNIVKSAEGIIELKEHPGGKQEDSIAMHLHLNTILANEKIFLTSMDNIVYQFDKEAKHKVLFLRKVEMLLSIITMFILLLEGLFVFRPAVKTIKKTIRELITSENNAFGLARKLMSVNRTLERSLKDLKDVNFALDNATILAKTDKRGKITFVNDKFCTVSGFARDELIGNGFELISGHYHSQTFFADMWSTIYSGRIWTSEIKNKAKDGTYFWLDATIVPIVDENNVPEQYLAIYTDVTQRFKQSINEQKIRSVSIIEGQEKERRKIARELHDGLGQMLTALKFNIEGLKGASSLEEKQNLVEIRKFTLETIREVRRISFNLMPSVLSDFGIISAVKHLVDQVSKHSGIPIVFEHNSFNSRFNKTIEISIYRIIQEGLNNALKYAKASEVNISLFCSDFMLTLIIEDNGIGFDRKITNNKDLISSGNGIANIQERTSLLNGEFTIDTAPGQGTKIRIDIPLKPIA